MIDWHQQNVKSGPNLLTDDDQMDRSNADGTAVQSRDWPVGLDSAYLEVFFDQIGVDRERGFGSFGGGDDHPLDRA